MANIKSAMKRVRQSLVRRDRNQQERKSVRSIEKKFRGAVSLKKKDEALGLLREYSSKAQRAAKKGCYPIQTVRRKIRRLHLFLNKALS